jgi:hypothetical protein
MRSLGRAVGCSVAVICGVLAGPATAHTGGLLGYTSSVSSIAPKTATIEFSVLEGDDQVYVFNRGASTVEVPGYGGEPYLRIRPSGVERNRNSPATYLNLDRYAEQPLPPNAKSSAKPVWERLSRQPAVAWHDHRAHWMNRVPPIAVRNAPTERHHIQDWTIPIRVAGRPVIVRGSLDYAPPAETAAKGSSGFATILWPAFAGAALVLAGLTLVVARRRGGGEPVGDSAGESPTG